MCHLPTKARILIRERLETCPLLRQYTHISTSEGFPFHSQVPWIRHQCSLTPQHMALAPLGIVEPCIEVPWCSMDNLFIGSEHWTARVRPFWIQVSHRHGDQQCLWGFLLCHPDAWMTAMTTTSFWLTIHMHLKWEINLCWFKPLRFQHCLLLQHNSPPWLMHPSQWFISMSCLFLLGIFPAWSCSQTPRSSSSSSVTSSLSAFNSSCPIQFLSAVFLNVGLSLGETQV